MAAHLMGRMFVPAGGLPLGQIGAILVALLVAGWLALRGPNTHDLHHEFAWTRPRMVMVAAAVGVCVSLMAAGGSSPFLYFQF
jgi:lysylphosphatidylglycerol synthetase-like protein (DUF2156 family)